jgi:hypothetical protein
MSPMQPPQTTQTTIYAMPSGARGVHVDRPLGVLGRPHPRRPRHGRALPHRPPHPRPSLQPPQSRPSQGPQAPILTKIKPLQTRLIRKPHPKRLQLRSKRSI